MTLQGGPFFADWYTYTQPFTGTVIFSVSAFFAPYMILQSNCGASTCLKSGLTTISYSLTANVPYYLIVTTSASSTTGIYTLYVTYPVPTNDNCAFATIIPNLPRTYTGTTNGATTDVMCMIGETSITSDFQNVWFKFTPTFNPSVVFSTCSSTSRQLVLVTSESCGRGQCIKYDYSSCPYGIESGWLQIPMQAGTDYFITVGYSPSPFVLDVFVPPQNDKCEGAVIVDTLPFSYISSTMYALPDLACSGTNRDIFFRFTPSLAYQNVQISLCGSGFDTVLYLATGACDSLSCIASNDNSDVCGLQSMLSGLMVTRGVTYFIVVSGASSADVGSVSLSITGSTATGCISAEEIPSIPYSYYATTSSISNNALSCGGPVLGAAGNFWFTYTPASTVQHVYIGACGSFNSFLYVATGSCGSLTCAMSSSVSEHCASQNTRGALIADVTLRAGVQYFFYVSGAEASDFGSFTLTLSN